MSKGKFLKTGILCIVLFLFSSCAVTLQHEKLNSPTTPATGKMAIASSAENMKSRIGSGTFTVFAISVEKVTVKGEASTELMIQIKDAVAQMGYDLKVVENPADSGGEPILTCNVSRFWFKNYTWFFPIVFNRGTIIMDVSIKSPEGNTLWNKRYAAKGRGTYSFNRPVKKALTRILNEMIADMITPEFRQKVWGTIS